VRFVHLTCLGLFIWLVGWSVQAASRALGVPLDLTARSGVGQVALYVIGLASVLLFIRFAGGISWERLRRALGPYWEKRQRVLAGFALMVAVTSGTFLLGYLLAGWAGAAHWNDAAWERLGWGRIFKTVVALAVVVVLAATEETLFRGFVFNYLRTGTRRAATLQAILGSSLIFALIHNFRDPLAWLSPQELPLLIGLTTLGVLLASTYLASGSLACAAGVHAGLIFVKVVFNKTHLVDLSQPHWSLGTDGDLRTAPVAWLYFAALAAGVWCWRRGLAARTRIEDEGGEGPPASPP
jgi:membrane protease YdiL (CAAX protease family)